jgi:hypothetical protein
MERIAWEPITLMLDSGKGMEKFCQVSLQKVTKPPSPPSLKWIHREGFKINSIRALTQLDFLLRKFEPWQHAQIGGQDQQDNENLAAFAAYLSQTNMVCYYTFNKLEINAHSLLWLIQKTQKSNSVSMPLICRFRPTG